MIDTLITIAVGLLYGLYTFILIQVKRSARQRKKLEGQEQTINPYARRDSLLLSILVILEVVLLFFYIFRFFVVYKYSMHLPTPLRLASLILGFIGVVIIGWASYTLDGEFSATIELKEVHRLITAGPYQYVRHPIYLGFILLHIGVTLALSNWIIFIAYNSGLFILLLERIPREEQVLHAYFGPEWEAYADSRGRLIPHFLNHHPRNKAE